MYKYVAIISLGRGILKKIQHLIPLNRFEAEGFSILNITEVTAEQAIKEVANLVIHNNQSDKKPLFEEVTHALQTVVGSRDYQFGIVPFLTINERPALIYENFPYSIIIQACWKYEVSKKYHIIKKRIDKVLILDMNERLTQPGENRHYLF